MFPQNSFISSNELKCWKHFPIDKGCLIYKGKVFMPKGTKTWHQILFKCHNIPILGHLGIRKTYARVKMMFFWSSLHKDVHDYVLQCCEC